MIVGGSPFTGPHSSQPLATAARRIEQVLLGSIATIAAAAIGPLMRSGRVPVRRGQNVVAGRFILFGAGAVAQGFAAITERGDAGPFIDMIPFANVSPPPMIAPPPPPQVYDAYADVSVPIR